MTCHPSSDAGSGHTAWRRLRAWQGAGVWDRLHRIGLEEPPEAQLLDCSRGCIDAVSANGGGELTGRNCTDRGKHGSKYHLYCDANGLPLHALISAANTHDSRLFRPVLDTNPGVSRRRGRRGRQRRPEKVHADKG